MGMGIRTLRSPRALWLFLRDGCIHGWIMVMMVFLWGADGSYHGFSMNTDGWLWMRHEHEIHI